MAQPRYNELTRFLLLVSQENEPGPTSSKRVSVKAEGQEGGQT